MNFSLLNIVLCISFSLIDVKAGSLIDVKAGNEIEKKINIVEKLILENPENPFLNQVFIFKEKRNNIINLKIFIPFVDSEVLKKVRDLNFEKKENSKRSKILYDVLTRIINENNNGLTTRVKIGRCYD